MGRNRRFRDCYLADGGGTGTRLFAMITIITIIILITIITIINAIIITIITINTIILGSSASGAPLLVWLRARATEAGSDKKDRFFSGFLRFVFLCVCIYIYIYIYIYIISFKLLCLPLGSSCSKEACDHACCRASLAAPASLQGQSANEESAN